MMVRSRSTITVWPAAPSQAQLVQPARAVAKRALGDLGEQPPQLILAHHPVRAQHREHAVVELGERDAAAVMRARTTRPDDTSTVSRSMRRRGQERVASRRER
jgi:hypothetical protein